jgi:hypothetical protein
MPKGPHRGPSLKSNADKPPLWCIWVAAGVLLVCLELSAYEFSHAPQLFPYDLLGVFVSIFLLTVWIRKRYAQRS